MVAGSASAARSPCLIALAAKALNDSLQPVITDLVAEPQHRRHHRVTDRHVDDDVGDADGRFQRRDTSVVELLARRRQPGIALVDDRTRQLFLRPEVEVEGTLGDLGLRDDLAEARVRVAQAQEHIRGTRQHGVARDLSACLSDHWIRLRNTRLPLRKLRANGTTRWHSYLGQRTDGPNNIHASL
jgi:hypothetical protein